MTPRQRRLRWLLSVDRFFGWLYAHEPSWTWPTFSPSPQRPWDWQVDGV